MKKIKNFEEIKFDRIKIAKITGHYKGCQCCWCRHCETSQIWEHTAKKFDEASETLKSIWPFGW